MTISSDIMSKLVGQENVFSWLDKKFSKKDRKDSDSGKQHYLGFRLNDLTIHEGDCVMINNDIIMDAYNFEIARILECIESDTSNVLGYAKVQWYTRIDKVKKPRLKQIPPGLPPLDGDREVVKDMLSYDSRIDIETISQKCCILEVPATCDPESLERPKGAVGHMYICRFAHIKDKPWVIPLKKRDLYSLPASAKLPTMENADPLIAVGGSPVKRCVKRKLLDFDEDQENASKAVKKRRGGEEARPEEIRSPKVFTRRKSVLREINDRQTEDFGRSDEPKIETVKYSGQARSLKGGEISDLLCDDLDDCLEASEKSASTPKSSKHQLFKKRLKLDDNLNYVGSPKKKQNTPVRIVSSPRGNLSPLKEIVSPLRRRGTPSKQSTSLSPKSDDEVEETSPKRTPRRRIDQSEFSEMSPSENKSSRPKRKTTPSRKMREYYFSHKNLKSADSANLGVSATRSPAKETKEKESFISARSPTSSKATPETRRSSKRSKQKAKPRIPERTVPVGASQSDFEVARERLHVSAVPEFLPCRQDEFQQIFSFVESKLLDSAGGCMYVSGVPGTGKTATVREVVRVLRECEEEGAVPSFKFLEVNAMKLTKPNQLWVQIWEGLTGQRATPDHAYSLISKTFGSRLKRESVFLLLDELDLLWTRKQDVMYNLFELSSQSSGRLVVVTIANTMDLPERMMINRVSSRLGLTRLTFHPYTFQQLQEIIGSRLSGLDVFESDAIQLVSRKVAAISGDARRALDICRRATELGSEAGPAQRKGGAKRAQKAPLIGMTQVSEAIQEMFSSPKIVAIRRSSQMERYLLQSVLTEFARTGIEEAVLMKVSEHLGSQCRLEGLKPPCFSDTLKLVYSLASQRILLTEHSRLDLTLRIRLNLSVDDVSYALS